MHDLVLLSFMSNLYGISMLFLDHKTAWPAVSRCCVSFHHFLRRSLGYSRVSSFRVMERLWGTQRCEEDSVLPLSYPWLFGERDRKLWDLAHHAAVPLCSHTAHFQVGKGGEDGQVQGVPQDNDAQTEILSVVEFSNQREYERKNPKAGEQSEAGCL